MGVGQANGSEDSGDYSFRNFGEGGQQSEKKCRLKKGFKKNRTVEKWESIIHEARPLRR